MISFTRTNHPRIILRDPMRKKIQKLFSEGALLRRILWKANSRRSLLTLSLTKTNNSSHPTTESNTMRILARRSFKTWSSTIGTRIGTSTTKILRSKTRRRMKIFYFKMTSTRSRKSLDGKIWIMIKSLKKKCASTIRTSSIRFENSSIVIVFILFIFHG